MILKNFKIKKIPFNIFKNRFQYRFLENPKKTLQEDKTSFVDKLELIIENCVLVGEVTWVCFF